jgi:hypothetical protein
MEALSGFLIFPAAAESFPVLYPLDYLKGSF